MSVQLLRNVISTNTVDGLVSAFLFSHVTETLTNNMFSESLLEVRIIFTVPLKMINVVWNSL